MSDSKVVRYQSVEYHGSCVHVYGLLGERDSWIVFLLGRSELLLIPKCQYKGISVLLTMALQKPALPISLLCCLQLPLQYFTLSNTRQFYLSLNRGPVVKGLKSQRVIIYVYFLAIQFVLSDEFSHMRQEERQALLHVGFDSW